MRHRDDIVLIGPPCVGKSTVATLLAQRLDLEHHEHDAMRLAYFEELGFDMAFNLRLHEEQGWATMFQYWQVFQPHAIERFFSDAHGVLDLGGGAPITSHPTVIARLERAFAPFRHVVLLVPDLDVDAAMAILATRSDADEALAVSQRYFLENGMLQRLATHTVVTGTATPAEVVEEVLRRVRGIEGAGRGT